MRPFRSDWRAWLALILLAVAIGCFLFSLEKMPDSTLRLLELIEWACALAIGALFSLIASSDAERRALQERAKPAIRRIATMLLAASDFLDRIPEARSVEDQLMAAHARAQVRELKAAVGDWKELLPDDYVDEIVKESSEAPTTGSLNWNRFDAIIVELAQRMNLGKARGGFQPHVLVSAHPAGTLVAYLLTLHLRESCPIVSCTLEKSAFAEEIRRHTPGGEEAECRVLIVDASIKSSTAMQSARAMVNLALHDRNLTVRTLAVVDYFGNVRRPGVTPPDFVGTTQEIDLPFAPS